MITHPKEKTKKTKRLTPAERERIAQAKAKGAGTAELSRRYGVTEQTIRNATRRVQIERQTTKVETAMVAARVPVLDIQIFDAAIGRLGVEKKSDAIRAFVRHPSGFLAPDEDLADAIRELRRELTQIGTNVNQIARRLNDPRLQPHERALSSGEAGIFRELNGRLNEASQALLILLGRQARRRDEAFRAIIAGAEHG